MADIKGIVLHKILSEEKGFLDAWSKLKLSYFGTEYAPIYRAIAKFYMNHSSLPTFQDLDLHNRNPILQVSLEALRASDPIEVDLDLAVEALINEYTQDETLKELDVFLDTVTTLEADEIKESLGNILLSIEEKTVSSEDIVLMNSIEFIKEEALLGLMPLGLNNTFDAAQGGMAPTEVLGIGGQRGSGKSVVCTNLMVNQYTSGNSAIYFSIEMRAREVFNRTLSILTGIPLTNITLARVTPLQLGKIAKVRSEMFLDAGDLYEQYLEHENFPKFEKELIRERKLKPDNQIVLVDNQKLTLANIDLTVHKYKAQFEDKLKLVVVDYINQIEMKDKYDWKNQIELSAQLKAIARKHDVILVTPYQIDASGEARFSKGILDSMDIAMILEREEGSGRIDFKSTKTRGKTKFEYASPMDEDTLKIDSNDFNLPPKKDSKKETSKENKEELPW